MPRWMNDEDDEVCDDDESVADDEDDEDDGDQAMSACPWCLRQIHEESELCPECGQYISREDAPIRKPSWIILAAALCLVLILGRVLVGFASR